MSLKRPRSIVISAAPALLAVVALASACSGNVSVGTDPTVSKSTLEKELSTQLEKTVGQAPDKVECPDDLKGKVGTTEKCDLTADGDVYGMTVTVTDVDGKDVKFSFKVDQQPKA